MNALSQVLAVVGLLSLSTVPEGQDASPAPGLSRQRPPKDFACARNDLTVYTGVVLSYRREVGRTMLSIRTDWDTTERVTLQHAGTDDPSTFFRLLGKPFAATDWPRIERSRGVLRPDVRAAAWVCTTGMVMVDWGAPRE